MVSSLRSEGSVLHIYNALRSQPANCGWRVFAVDERRPSVECNAYIDESRLSLVELASGTSDWHDVKYGALILSKASSIPDVTNLQNDLRDHHLIPALPSCELYTGINQNREAILVHNNEETIFAFQGSADNEIHMNFWIDGKGPNWWEMPYAVHVNGHRVHSFYLDMWNGMKKSVFSALSDAVATMRQHGMAPKKVIIAGYSMGGGASSEDQQGSRKSSLSHTAQPALCAVSHPSMGLHETLGPDRQFALSTVPFPVLERPSLDLAARGDASVRSWTWSAWPLHSGILSSCGVDV